jgi:hypothetical protein
MISQPKKYSAGVRSHSWLSSRGFYPAANHRSQPQYQYQSQNLHAQHSNPISRDRALPFVFPVTKPEAN